MNKQITSLNNQLQQMLQSQTTPATGGLTQLNQYLNFDMNTVDSIREHIAKAEALIQDALTNMEGQGNKTLMENLNQLQTELMNYSQSLEHRAWNQTKTQTIPGEPLNMDTDPEPGPPLS